MSDSRYPIGPGQNEMCRRCADLHKQEYAYRIADHVEQHPELMNGDKYLHDLVRLRRGQRGDEGEV